MILMIGWRGEPGVKDEPQHIHQGRVTLKMLENMDIPYIVLSKNEDQSDRQIKNMIKEVGSGLDFAVYNVGNSRPGKIIEMDANYFRESWESCCFGGFLFAKEVVKSFLSEKTAGTIIFTGATASIRGKEGFAAFAGAKHAKRALAQSMARELGPKGIHVAHIIIDGAIDTPWVNKLFPDYVKQKKKIDGLMNPDDIAQNYLMIHNQPKNSWTFEIDLRPWVETW